MAKIAKYKKSIFAQVLIQWYRHELRVHNSWIMQQSTVHRSKFKRSHKERQPRIMQQITHPPLYCIGSIYLTEASGVTIGANVMRDHNIVFDYDNHLVGFADGACDYHADSKGPGHVGNSAVAEVCTSVGRACMCGAFFFRVSCCVVGCRSLDVLDQTAGRIVFSPCWWFVACVRRTISHGKTYRIWAVVHSTTRGHWAHELLPSEDTLRWCVTSRDDFFRT